MYISTKPFLKSCDFRLFTFCEMPLGGLSVITWAISLFLATLLKYISLFMKL